MERTWNEASVTVEVDGNVIMAIHIDPHVQGKAAVASFIDPYAQPEWVLTFASTIPTFVREHYRGNGISDTTLDKHIERLARVAAAWYQAALDQDAADDGE